MEVPERSYQQKAHALIQDHQAHLRQMAIEGREAFYGLQVEPSASFENEGQEHHPGERNWVFAGFDIHPQVTLVSAALLILFLGFTLVFREQAESIFKSTLNWISSYMGWLYILSANIFILMVSYFAFSRFGNIRIGGPDALPEFSTFAWYAMLISAGMGIGLMFWGVAEPMYHLNSPSPLYPVEAGSLAAVQPAMAVTYFHWGLHPWSMYALVSLGLAFFAFNRGLPLTIRSIFYPLLGERIYGFWGHVIDVLSVLATLFGLATSLGFGAQQVSAGFHFLFGTPDSINFQVLLIVMITGLATLSVVAGLDGGVKRLSQLNIWLAGGFMLFLFILGPTVYILKNFTQSLGYYLQNLPQMSFWVEAQHGLSNKSWQSSWTLFYWGWWISWSPFVGMFIARVSKGRTIREFVLGVMVFPTLLSFLWMSTFGGTATWLQLQGRGKIYTAVQDNVATALFKMLENFPLTQFMCFLGAVLVISFFVTSSDSGSLVVDHLTSGGKLDSPVPQRVFWAVMEGLCAAVLLLGGGLSALQTATIATGLPFALVLCVMCYSLYKGLAQEHFHYQNVQKLQERSRLMGISPTPMRPQELSEVGNDAANAKMS